ncbi:MAG: TonB-dependent receptor [Bacteroidota bacterium]
MKLSTLFMLAAFFTMQANDTYGQRTTITLNLKNVSVGRMIDEMEKNYEFEFVYKLKDVDLDRIVSVKARKKKISNVLNQVFKNTRTTYNLYGQRVYLIPREEPVTTDPPKKPDSKEVLQSTVSGTVTDTDGTPLPGASILEKGTTNGVTSDFDGKFSITVEDENAILVISYIGFGTTEVPIAARSIVNITLEESTSALDEIVVIGYGTLKKSDLTGSVSSLRSEDFNPGANVSVDQLLQGRAAGVQISQASSAPGGGLSIRIRGASSLNAGNEPLYVIDGYPIDNSPNLTSGGAAQVSANNSPRNPLNALNPGDIESIEILKDASATAIYGSRGANGVIMITTKKGREGQMSVTYDVYAGMQTVAETIDVLSTSEYINAINALSLDQGNDIVFSDEDIARIGQGTDWQEQIFRTAPVTNHNLSVQGGTEKTSIYASFNYFDQDGVVKNSGIKRFTGRINIDTKIGERAQLGINLNTSLVQDNNNVDGVNTNEQAGPINTSQLYDPTEPIFNDDGSISQSPNLTINNPVALVEGISNLSETNRTFGTVFLNYDFTENLSGKLNFGTDRQTTRRDIFNSTQTIRGGNQGGIANIEVLERSNYLFEYTMNYNKTFNQKHDFTVLGGITFQQFDIRTFGGNINGFPTDEIGTNNLALGDTNNDDLRSRKEENSLLSYLGRVNYSFDNKYLITASIRADGSSRFGENNKFGYFPSFALGWKLSEESFIPDVFSELKLRASWGQTGNQEIGNFNSLLTFGNGRNVVLGGNIEGSVIPARIANPDLKWETTEQLDVGLDIGLFNGRISTTLDYFTRNTTDLLFNLPLPLASGFGSILTNVGEVENSGFEILINSNNIATEDFKWDTSLNFSTIRNEVVDLGRVADSRIVTGNVQGVGNTSVIQEGDPLASYFGYVVTGFFQEGDDIANSAQPTAQPGFPIFEDRNGDSVINPDDQTIIGSPFPDFIYGIRNSFQYKNWNLDVFFQGQEGADLLNVNLIESLYPANFRRNRLAETILDRWTPQNTDAQWPSSTNPNAYGGSKVNTLTVEDASFFRLKNVQLSYNVPMGGIDFINSLKLYVTGQNLFTITDYRGFDPEANSFGASNVRIDYSSYPLARTYLLGLTANF